MFEAQARKKNVALYVTVDATVPDVIISDKIRLRQVPR
jgi:hypothetical protein